MKRLKTEAKVRKPNLIIFAIGINDSLYKHSINLGVSPKMFLINLQKLIDQAKGFTSNIVFLGLTKINQDQTTSVNWNNDIYYIEKNVKLYNKKIKEICTKSSLQFIEIFNLLNKSDLEDGLHPNSQGHKKMFIKVKDFLISRNIV